MSKQKIKTKSMRLGYGDGKVRRMIRRGWKLEQISGGGLGSARMATFSKVVTKKGAEPDEGTS